MADEKSVPSVDSKLMETAKRVLDKACPQYFMVFGDENGIGWGGNVNRTWAMGALRRALISLEQAEKMDAIKDYQKDHDCGS